MNFKDKYGEYALITGGNAGIGSEFASQIAQKGLNLVLVARRENLLEKKAIELRKKYNIKVKTIRADLSKIEEIQKVVNACDEIEVGLLILNAGMETHGIFPKLDLDKEIMSINLNITSSMTLSHHFVNKMIPKRRGGIIFVSSLLGHMPTPYLSNYAGTKSYILNFGNSLNGEVKKFNIDVTVLSPGPTKTPMAESMAKGFIVPLDKLPMTLHQPNFVVKVGLDALGKKAVVIPGIKNSMLGNIGSRMPTDMAIKSGASMMEKFMNPEDLKL
jgi:short-subunit dehydrogenase|tara:strand:+ start:669 stop:1487 length:819 start_codon:yes stop_codon:yes gene_type:complete